MSEDLRDQCRVVNLRDQVLTVHTAGAAWATRLRFEAPQLLTKLNRLTDFAPVREIKVWVSSPANVPDVTSNPILTLSTPNGDALNELAQQLDYGELREAVLRLARQGNAGRDAQSET